MAPMYLDPGNAGLARMEVLDYGVQFVGDCFWVVRVLGVVTGR